MSHFSVHDPIHGRPDLVEKYKKKLAKMKPQPGPDYILEGNPDSPTFPTRAELDELIKRPLYANSYKSYPNDLVKVKQKQDNVQLAGMVEAVDQSLGTLVAKLKEHGLEDNTIVILHVRQWRHVGDEWNPWPCGSSETIRYRDFKFESSPTRCQGLAVRGRYSCADDCEMAPSGKGEDMSATSR